MKRSSLSEHATSNAVGSSSEMTDAIVRKSTVSREFLLSVRACLSVSAVQNSKDVPTCAPRDHVESWMQRVRAVGVLACRAAMIRASSRRPRRTRSATASAAGILAAYRASRGAPVRRTPGEEATRWRLCSRQTPRAPSTRVRARGRHLDRPPPLIWHLELRAHLLGMFVEAEAEATIQRLVQRRVDEAVAAAHRLATAGAPGGTECR